MSQDESSDSPHGRDTGAAWGAFSYLVAGVFLYGGLGWLLDWWLGTGFLLPVGIVAGAALGLYLVIRHIGST